MTKTNRELLLELAAEYTDEHNGASVRAKAELAASNPLVERPWLLLWKAERFTFGLAAGACVWALLSPTSPYARGAAALLLLASGWAALRTATFKLQARLLIRALRWLHRIER